MFAKVIVGFDGSDHARDALALSQCLAAPVAELTVCCVHRFNGPFSRVDLEEPRLDRAAAERCVQTACQLPQGTRTMVPLAVPGAGAAQTLQATAEQRGAEVLVLGSSHRGPVGRALVGSVTEEALHEGPCVIAVAPVGFHRKCAGSHLRCIAVAYDVVTPPLEALNLAVALASQTDAELRLIAVADIAAAPTDRAGGAMSHAAVVEARLDATKVRLARALNALPEGISATGTVCDGRVSEELLEVTQGADLLVLGSRSRGPLRRLLLGSVSDTVVRAAACPVLVIPSGSRPDDRAGSVSEARPRQVRRAMLSGQRSAQQQPAVGHDL
jgi:nucleotide-binding universal stress UspA family protein